MGIATLAKAGFVKAIVTTNFDRVLEAAFQAKDVPFEKHASPADFYRPGLTTGQKVYK
jgi:hypothetical protein